MDKRILVVDDEETLCDALKFNMEAEGYQVDVAYSAEEALTMDLAQYDLMLLDIMMGDISGIQLAEIIKSNPATSSLPIIFCTAKDTEDDMVRGLDLGADDYIMKPYSIRNVLARVRSVLRRTSDNMRSSDALTPNVVGYKSLVVLPDKKVCLVNGKEIKMPRKEFEILLMLMSNIGKVFTREEILNAIWTEEVVVIDRVVDVNITRIRQKIGEYGRNVVTRSGYGYGFFAD